MTSRGVVATPVIEPARAPAQQGHLTFTETVTQQLHGLATFAN